MSYILAVAVDVDKFSCVKNPQNFFKKQKPIFGTSAQIFEKYLKSSREPLLGPGEAIGCNEPRPKKLVTPVHYLDTELGKVAFESVKALLFSIQEYKN